MQSQISHTSALGSSNPDDNVADRTADPREKVEIPAAVILSLAHSVIAANREIIAERDLELAQRDELIAALKRRLELVGAMLRPPGAVLQ